jgi:hypothetical protein
MCMGRGEVGMTALCVVSSVKGEGWVTTHLHAHGQRLLQQGILIHLHVRHTTPTRPTTSSSRGGRGSRATAASSSAALCPRRATPCGGLAGGDGCLAGTLLLQRHPAGI